MMLPTFKQEEHRATATVDFARPVTYESYLSLIPAFNKKTDDKPQQQLPADPYKAYLSMIPHFAAKATGDSKAVANEPLSYDAYTKLMPHFPKTPPPSPTSFDSQSYVATMPTFISNAKKNVTQAPDILASYASYLKTIPSFSYKDRAADAEVAGIS